ncbi:MAG: response regulator [Actinobacteria bacterium]|nr:response regulator [Actinomycetota bacterium]
MATIVVVDDNATNRALLVRVLERDGHRVVEAANGAEALGLIWVEQPDLVLTDVLMPRVDGYALDRALRSWSRTADLPLIFHTATYTSDEVRELAGTHPHRRVLPKPSDLDAITAMVRRLLEGAAGEAPGEPEPDGDNRGHLDLLNAKLLQKVRELELADRERQQLLASVVRAQEEERERIANDIHDDPVQAMTAVAMRLELLGPPTDDPRGRQRHEKLLATVRHAISRLRHLLFELHPAALETDGLAAAIGSYLERLVEDTSLSFVVEDELGREPTTELRAILYRVVQEAVTNVAKHARATTIRVRLREQDGGYLAIVEDDGEGFVVEQVETPPSGHLGLTAMRQRAQLAGGWWQVESEPGSGTTVRTWVPAAAFSERAG